MTTEMLEKNVLGRCVQDTAVIKGRTQPQRCKFFRQQRLPKVISKMEAKASL